MREGRDTTVRQRSGWLIPLGVFVVTAILSALLLVYYLAPPPAAFIEERPTPTARTDRVNLAIGDTAFAIPANYLEYRSARQGGTVREVALFAILPDFRGYSDWDSSLFAGNAADSPVVYMLIGEERYNISEAERLNRIYLGYVSDPKGQPGPFGLTAYTFRADSGYGGEDLFVGHLGKRIVVFRCDRGSLRVPSPSCLRDERIGHHLSVSYRFKRTQLSHWREIAVGVNRLIQSFKAKA